MTPADALTQARHFSHYLQRQLSADPSLEQSLPALIDQPVSTGDFSGFTDWDAIQSADTLMPALRRLRQQTLARLICRDLAGWADLDEVVSAISALADFAVGQALRVGKLTLDSFGAPIGEESGTEQELIVIGMGKLGGHELNVSSDIDLIFIYDENGETNGRRRLSNHEYFVRLGKEIIRLLDDVTADGRVFRVDMRLRPYGDSGPLVMSMSALENYLIAQGREWERYAWIKARPLSGDADSLGQLARPFVYRKYLDYNAYGAMRDLHEQVRREVARRDMADNIKLGAGGIREIEFIAQVFQLVRGGREKSLQRRSTRGTLRSLGELHLLDTLAVEDLQQAYAFLRNLEHRLQYQDDQQTQTLPADPDVRQKIAASMGFSDWAAFMQQLNHYRAIVSRHFEQVFLLPGGDAPAEHALTPLWRDIADTDASDTLATLGYRDPENVQRLLRTIAGSSRYQQMPEQSREKLDRMIGPLLEAAAQTDHPDTTLSRLFDLLEAIGRRAAYLALLSEHPHTLNRLAALYGASSWLSSYMTRHPILLDELLDPRVLYAPPDWPQLSTQLAQQLTDCDPADTESKMDVLRHFQHAQTFRLATQDLAGMWTVEALSDELSRLADIILDAALQHAWLTLPKRHIDLPRFAIVGYGKLGGKELGYASDLDLIFLYDDDHPDASDLYARLARRLTTWLTSVTSAGMLYDIDLRLRPNGSSGMLVSRIEAFTEYQYNQAWIWEHQALTRARYVAGDVAIGQRFETIRHELLVMPRNRDELRQAVIDIREKMFPTHPPLDSDVKYARGGVVDVEFIVQYLILEHAHNLPELTRNSGNIALLAVAADAGLIDPALAGGARTAYRHYRSLQHAVKLHDATLEAADDVLLEHYRTVKALWTQVFAVEPTAAV